MPPPRALTTAGLALAGAGLLLTLVMPGLGEHGLWSEGELAVLDRTLAALGEARSGLERSPAVPDALRTLGFALWPGEFGLRFAHSLASALCVAMTIALARRRGASTLEAGLAGLVLLSMPSVGIEAATALGNPFTELCATAAVWAGLGAAEIERAEPQPLRRKNLLWWLGAAVCLTVGVGAGGLCLGLCIPLVGLATLWPLPSSRSWVVPALWIALGVSLAAVVIVAWRQQDGYIPVLAAAKDLEAIGKPGLRRFASAFAAVGYQTFPWLPVALVGAALGRDRALAQWLLGAAVLCAGWSLSYNASELPVRVPVALAGAAGLRYLIGANQSSTGQRFGLAFAVLGILLVTKDLELFSQEVAIANIGISSNDYPGELLDLQERFAGSARGLLLCMVILGAGMGVRYLRPPWYRGISLAVVVGVSAMALGQAWLQVRVIIPETSRRMSPKHMLAMHDDLAATGKLAPNVGVYRVRDRGLAWYGGTQLQTLSDRREIAGYLAKGPDQAMILRISDVPAIYQERRQAGLPFAVLDDEHAQLRLVASDLPAGEVDRNPIPEILSSQPFVLANQTYVAFEDYLEVIGWELEPELVRGRKYTLKLSLRVNRPPPGGTKIFARLVGGRLSVINPEPQELAEGLYPCTLWRKGDHILHRFTFSVPLLGVHSGTYDFVIALRRGETKNFTIRIPEGNKGEFGVEIRDRKRAFAHIGQVQVW